MDSTVTEVDPEDLPEGPAARLVLAMRGSDPLAERAAVELGTAYYVEVGRGDRLSTDRVRGGLRLNVPDRRLSSQHLLLTRNPDGWMVRDLGSKNGTYVDGAACPTSAPLRDGAVIGAGACALVLRQDGAADATAGIDTDNTAVAEVYRSLARVAPSSLPIIIRGETGTGKEVAARRVHELSKRSGTLQAVNCGGLPPTLIESELFGVRRGAFTGALEDRPGLIREAHGGTLFLDEIAELPASAQAALLRVLQEREVRPVGATAAVPVDVRVIAATHQDLAALVASGAFRDDLYARLRGLEVVLPPLRERREDLGRLVAALLPRCAGDRAAAVRFHPAAVRALFAYAWPRNVRELEQTLAAAVMLADEEIGLDHLPPELRAPPEPPSPPARGGTQGLTAERMRALVAEHRGNVSAVARALETSRSQVRRLAARLGVDLSAWR